MSATQNFATDQGKIYNMAPIIQNGGWNSAKDLLEYDITADEWIVKRSFDEVCNRGQVASFKRSYYVRAY